MKKLVSVLVILTFISMNCAIAEQSGGEEGLFGRLSSLFTRPFWRKTYTVTYFDENGEEIFPAFENQIMVEQLLYGITYTAEELAAIPVEQKRAIYQKGDEVFDYPVPLKEGYAGRWDLELPDVMDGKDYELHAVYEIGQFTLVIQDGHNPTDEHDEKGEAHEHEVFFELTATFGEPLDLSSVRLPDAPEGYTVEWSEPLPETMPGFDTYILAMYKKIAD